MHGEQDHLARFALQLVGDEADDATVEFGNQGVVLVRRPASAFDTLPLTLPPVRVQDREDARTQNLLERLEDRFLVSRPGST